MRQETNFSQGMRVVWDRKQPSWFIEDLTKQYGAGPFQVLAIDYLLGECTCELQNGAHHRDCALEMRKRWGHNQGLILNTREGLQTVTARYFEPVPPKKPAKPITT